jgi:hypothetical protein
MRCASVLTMLFLAAPAAADDAATTTPASTNATTPSAPTTTNVTSAQLSAFLVIDVPAPPPVSLRLEAIRAVNENWENSWRYPQPGDVLGVQGGLWYMGDYMYRPRTKRSGALHGASIGATLAGEILMGSGSPLAGVGAFLTGATLDAAAADSDRDAEARNPRR